MKINSHLQSKINIELLNKVSESISTQQDWLEDSLSKLQFAEQSLKLIATWADVPPFDDKTMIIIRNRAMDTLKLIGAI